MATFKLGSRVKLVSYHRPEHIVIPVGHVPRVPLGTEGIVMGAQPDQYVVCFAGFDSGYRGSGFIGCYGCADYMLAPLAPPSADSEWAAEKLAALVKRVASEPLPLTEKQLGEVRAA